MSGTTSVNGNRPYGVQQVCRTWEQPRSSFYLARQAARPGVVRPLTAKRGPKTALSDQALLGLIKADLESSPFKGEGHRKVWARLRVRDGVRSGRKRVLRIMRENNLLSLFRGRCGSAILHDGQIVTQAPDLMWGTDGARVFTVDEGWVWVFVAVEHWNAECVGWHVCKHGSRYAAMEPVAQGLITTFGSVAADVGRGLSLRMDHGTQYLSDHFLNQLRYWGISPSFAFIEQPQTNGVAERFNRTLKEQVIHGRFFHAQEGVPLAVANFVEWYNDLWLVEKNDFRCLRQARRDWQNGGVCYVWLNTSLCPENRVRYTDNSKPNFIFSKISPKPPSNRTPMTLFTS